MKWFRRDARLQKPVAPAAPHEPELPWEPDLGAFESRLALRLSDGGHPWPELAATCITRRGALAADRARFALLLGITPAAVAFIEDGAAPAISAP